MNNIKSWLTDILAAVLTVFAAVQVYMGTLGEGDPINWFQFAVAVVTAVISFFTGRTGDGKIKSNPTHN